MSQSASVSDGFSSSTAALDCWFLTGATASGKTQVGLELADRLGAEVISLDSMAVYRGMDIGTAKPSWADRARVAHHLIDIRNPDEEFSLSDYLEAAWRRIREIRGRGREVLFVGGTPLYLKALLRGACEGPPPDWDFRREVAAEARRVGLAALHERLQQVDPLSAARLHPNDMRRIIRALEFYKLTGRPISHAQTQFEEGRRPEQCKVFVLNWPRALLHERINRRVEWMFEAGLVEEVRRLLDRYGRLGRTAGQAVGYREVIEHVRGGCGLEETIERVKTRTRRFARRQETWFRSLTECRPTPMGSGAAPAEVADRILAAAARSG